MRKMLMMVALAASSTAMIAATPQAEAPEEWNVDKAHTEVTFSVRHFFTPVTGKFDDFDVSLVYDAENVGNSKVTATIPVASIDTNNENRDEHLRSDDFFGVGTYPNITFESTAVRRVSATELVATGNLTIKGVTREVQLPITILGVQELEGAMAQQMGVSKVASFKTTLEINRNDFTVGTGNWAAATVIGRDVTIEIAVEANQPAM